MCSTRGAWLPGDPRGFRDHDHRIHSSGDYRSPPPSGEHARLHRYARDITKKFVQFTPEQRSRTARAIMQKLDLMQAQWRVLAVGATHVHLLACIDSRHAKREFGRIKQFASHTLRDELPGTIWGEGCLPLRVKNEQHYRSIVNYILAHEAEGACVMEHPAIVARREQLEARSASHAR